MTTTFLSSIKAGDRFTLDGASYHATGDAHVVRACVFVSATRANAAMPSGTEIADVLGLCGTKVTLVTEGGAA